MDTYNIWFRLFGSDFPRGKVVYNNVSHGDLEGVNEGFWLDKNSQICDELHGERWVPPSQILGVERVKG